MDFLKKDARLFLWRLLDSIYSKVEDFTPARIKSGRLKEEQPGSQRLYINGKVGEFHFYFQKYIWE